MPQKWSKVRKCEYIYANAYNISCIYQIDCLPLLLKVRTRYKIMNKDFKNTALHIVNGIICDYKDFTGIYPTVENVRNNFNFPKYADISDNEISHIIEMVKKYDK